MPYKIQWKSSDKVATKEKSSDIILKRIIQLIILKREKNELNEISISLDKINDSINYLNYTNQNAK